MADPGQQQQPVPTPEQILQLYDELGRPSATKFQIALRRRLGLKVSVADVQRIVGPQSECQVLSGAWSAVRRQDF